MSETPGAPTTSGPAASGGPRPEPLRFFGTTWLEHGGGYVARRIGVAAGALVGAVAGCLVLRFAFEGLAIADIGSFVTVLVVVVFAVCSALSLRRTWQAFGRRFDAESQAPLRGFLGIGFIGVLLAYFLRSFVEAPGEGLNRAEYEAARAEYARRSARRTGNPARRGRRP